MNIFFRMGLAFYAFFLMIFSVMMMCMTLMPEYLRWSADYMIHYVLPNRNASIVLFFIEFIFFALSIVFLLSGVKSDREKRVIKKSTNLGEINISLASIESIVLAAIRKLTGVKETKANVRKTADGISISVRVIIIQEVNMPTLLEDIQVRVKKSVEEISGVKVLEVNASVENVNTTYRARVE